MIQEVQPEIKFTYEVETPNSQSEPWMSEHTKNINNPIVRFHNQIIQFANYVEPTNDEHEARLKICTEFQTELKAMMPDAQVLWPFLKNKLYLKSTELQIYIFSQKEGENWQEKASPAIQKIAQKLSLKIYNLSVQLSNQECRVIAEHQPTNIQIWFRFIPLSWKQFITDMDSCVANSLEIKYLYLVFFCMLRQRSFHTMVRSLFIYGICSFFVYERRNQRVRTLTQNVIKFLEFFSIGIAQDKDRKITYKEGNIYRYTMNSDRTLSFEIAQKVDLASSRKVRDFLKVLQNRYRVLGNYYFAPGTSVLAHLINPCHNKFFY